MTKRRDFIKFGAAAAAATAVAQYVQIPAITVAGRAGPRLGLPPAAEASVQVAQTPLLGSTVPKYVEPIPLFGSNLGLVAGQVNAPRVTGTAITVTANELQQKVLPASFYAALPASATVTGLPAINPQLGTYVWAYNVGNTIPLYPGITIEAQRNFATDVTYVNNLPAGGASYVQKFITVDQSIHWANPMGLSMMDPARMQPYTGPLPIVAHLHGAEVSSSFDGGPDQWFTPDGKTGLGYRTYAPGTLGADANGAVNALLLDPVTGKPAAKYHYVNQQEATTIWFHDHTLGATRTNVYAGMAAFYLVRDQFDTGLDPNPLGLPAGPYEREIVIQDRQFDTNGQWFFPDSVAAMGLNGPPPNPLIHPFWNPEFFGDVIVVNGKSWPYMNVEPRRYRFRLLDGSNARVYELSLGSKLPFWVIGNDGGLLDTPAQASVLRIAPGERYDVIVDFAPAAGSTVVMTNSAPAPYPAGVNPDQKTVANIMQFRVGLPTVGFVDPTFNPAAPAKGLPPTLRGGAGQPPAIVRLANPLTGTLAAGVTPTVTRQLVLVEVAGPGGPVEVLVNNTKWDGTREGNGNPVPAGGMLPMVPIQGMQPDGQGNYLSELPQVGTTEVWEIVNLTMDAHPIHLHLTQFQLMNRQNIQTKKYRTVYDSQFPAGWYGGIIPGATAAAATWGPVNYLGKVFIPAYGPPLAVDGSNALSAGKWGGNPDITPYLQGGVMPPAPEESGWKDTVVMFPDQVSRIVVRFAPQDVAVGGVVAGQNLYGFDPRIGPGYVWHCHIVDHEDNEMMRPYHPI